MFCTSCCLCCCLTIIRVLKGNSSTWTGVCNIYIFFLKSLASLCTHSTLAEVLATLESHYMLEPTCHNAQTADILQAV